LWQFRLELLLFSLQSLNTLVEQTSVENHVRDEQELVSLVSEQGAQSASRNHLHLSGMHGINSGASEVVDIATDASPLHDDITRVEAGASSQNAGALVVSTSTSPSGISLFQG